MRRRIAMVVLLGALLMPTVAVAKSSKLVGTVAGDSNSSITMKVKIATNSFPPGAPPSPLKVKKFQFTGVDNTCGREVSGLVKNVPIGGAGPAGSSGGFVYEAETLESDAAAGSDAFGIDGSIDQKSKRSSGTISFFEATGEGTFTPCGEVAYDVKKKKKGGGGKGGKG